MPAAVAGEEAFDSPFWQPYGARFALPKVSFLLAELPDYSIE